MPAILKIHRGHGQVSEGHHDTQRFANPCRQGACDAVILQDRALSDRDRALSLTRHLQVLSCWRISEPGGRLAGNGARSSRTMSSPQSLAIRLDSTAL